MKKFQAKAKHGKPISHSVVINDCRRMLQFQWSWTDFKHVSSKLLQTPLKKKTMFVPDLVYIVSIHVFRNQVTWRFCSSACNFLVSTWPNQVRKTSSSQNQVSSAWLEPRLFQKNVEPRKLHPLSSGHTKSMSAHAIESQYKWVTGTDQRWPPRCACLYAFLLSTGLELLALVLQSSGPLGRECPEQQLGADLTKSMLQSTLPLRFYSILKFNITHLNSLNSMWSFGPFLASLYSLRSTNTEKTLTLSLCTSSSATRLSTTSLTA